MGRSETIEPWESHLNKKKNKTKTYTVVSNRAVPIMVIVFWCATLYVIPNHWVPLNKKKENFKKTRNNNNKQESCGQTFRKEKKNVLLNLLPCRDRMPNCGVHMKMERKTLTADSEKPKNVLDCLLACVKFQGQQYLWHDYIYLVITSVQLARHFFFFWRGVPSRPT